MCCIFGGPPIDLVLPPPAPSRVTGLHNKHKYRFRTRAVNKIGTSEPCEMLGDDILIKDPWGEREREREKEFHREFAGAAKILRNWRELPRR